MTAGVDQVAVVRMECGGPGVFAQMDLGTPGSAMMPRVVTTTILPAEAAHLSVITARATKRNSRHGIRGTQYMNSG